MWNPRVRQHDLVVEEVQGECVIYDSIHKKAHHLNTTLSWVWKHCDGSRRIDELAAALQRDLGADDAASVVASGLQQLVDANLLEPKSFDPAFIPPVPTVSRRSVIAGASIVAAPVISSILAPTPAAAKSKPEKEKPPKEKDKGK